MESAAVRMPQVDTETIEARVRQILEGLPPGVSLVAAAKSRTPDEVRAAIRGGVTCVGHNYVQEAQRMIGRIDVAVQWHLIGHLQRNKAKMAVDLFDMIETLDSGRLAEALERRCAAVGRVMPVLVEVNSGREANKTGVMPEDVEDLVPRLSQLKHLHVQGLMTMGPRFGDPESARPYFRATRAAFDRLRRLDLPNVSMCYLSMGMSNSYRVAIEEGANLVRIGSSIFGPRSNRE